MMGGSDIGVLGGSGVQVLGENDVRVSGGSGSSNLLHPSGGIIYK